MKSRAERTENARLNRAKNKKMANEAHARGGFFVVAKLMEKVISKVKSRANDRQRALKWAKDKPEHANKNNRKWARANPEKVANKQRRYRKDNPELRVREREKYATDLEHQLKVRLRARLRYHWRKTGASKDKNTMTLVGCSPMELVDHLGCMKGQIDHIFPLARYDAATEQHTMTRWENLQILTFEENNQKNNKLPTKAMAEKVPRHLWPQGVTYDMLPDIYPGWATPLEKRTTDPCDDEEQ